MCDGGHGGALHRRRYPGDDDANDNSRPGIIEKKLTKVRYIIETSLYLDRRTNPAILQHCREPRRLRQRDLRRGRRRAGDVLQARRIRHLQRGTGRLRSRRTRKWSPEDGVER